MKFGLTIVLLGFVTVTAFASPTDTQIKQAIIRESLASYPGNCPCPYSSMRNGQACGKRSAYSKPGGYSPICYEADVTPEMVNEYRKARN